MSKPYSENTADMIDSEVRNLVEHAKERTLQILTEVTYRARCSNLNHATPTDLFHLVPRGLRARCQEIARERSAVPRRLGGVARSSPLQREGLQGVHLHRSEEQ